MDYFPEPTFSVPYVDEHLLRDIVNCCNGDEIVVNQSKVRSLLYAANYLVFEKITLKCVEFLMDSLNIKNCVQMYTDATMCLIDDLRERSLELSIENFENIPNEQFLAGDISFIRKLLNSENINAREDSICLRTIQWIEAEIQEEVDEKVEHEKERTERSTFARELFQLIKLDLITNPVRFHFHFQFSSFFSSKKGLLLSSYECISYLK